MPDYTVLLVAVDLSEEANQVIEGALRAANQDASHIHLAHVAEHPVTGIGELIGRNHRATDFQVRQKVYPGLKALADAHGIPANNLHILLGEPADELHALAEKMHTELIVCGSHGRKGFELLLGSTATRLLHGASCDVLTVRIQAEG
ncbi:universal stress protein [Marinimicrobium alkaliphilum]|uniref:universal stress protein n=1 Tax=Marinimicrobium alkaliphilum TaxID=2202654 RepID=UPI0013006EF0|nr:universal stress protein [Marinimicrobium alkaliphilum]